VKVDPTWEPSAAYWKVVEANRRFYAGNAELYDSTETCLVDPRAQRMLDDDLDRILSLLGRPAAELHALDACAGSGHIALKLLARGVRVTAADVSSDLLAVFEKKAEGLPPRYEVVCDDVGRFLAGTAARFDLIVFSSALHHLEDPDAVLALAGRRLGDGGLLFTVFDPTPRGHRPVDALMWLDYLTFKLTRQSRDLPAALGRRLRRTCNGLGGRRAGKGSLDLSDENLGVLAEYHVETGIDDHRLAGVLADEGLELLWHHRYAGARWALTRALLDRAGWVTAFKLLARNPGRGTAP
jgi:SAM-dependent methyltransferase